MALASWPARSLSTIARVSAFFSVRYHQVKICKSRRNISVGLNGIGVWKRGFKKAAVGRLVKLTKLLASNWRGVAHVVAKQKARNSFKKYIECAYAMSWFDSAVEEGY